MAYKFETLALHAGTQTDQTMTSAVPVHRTASYLFKNTEHASNLFGLKESGNIYTRIMNPTQDVLEKRIAALEGGGAALALASGTSAVFYTVINICGNGNEVVSSNRLYGGTYTMFNNILPELGVKVRFADPQNPESFEEQINENTRLIYSEVIGNPVLDVPNLKSLSEIAKKHNIPFAVDSTFATPYLIRPLEYGVDIVIHSLTKWLGGHGTGIGGIVVDSCKFNWKDEKFHLYNEPDGSYHNLKFAHDLGELNALAFILRMRLVPLRNLGACISPDNSWIFLQGLETLALRMQRHCDNAYKTAEFLKSNSKVSWVRYPGLSDDLSYKNAKEQFENGFGGMIVFGIKGGRAAGEKFINNLKLFSHLANVGDAKSLAIHPASTTHSQLNEKELKKAGINEDMVRLSVGIENIEDIIEDISRALG
jgi:O-acetylhomoserine (thiol)-lyase